LSADGIEAAQQRASQQAGTQMPCDLPTSLRHRVLLPLFLPVCHDLLPRLMRMINLIYLVKLNT
jgi:hypothetical protein